MSSEVGIAQVGIGYWGRNLLRNFASVEGARLVQACDQRPNVLQQVSAQFPGVKVTQDYEDLLTNPDVDAVVVATETPTHFEMASRALKAGKHVFVEKPMAQSVPEAEELVRLAEERDLRLMVGHLLLYHPAFRYIEDLIEAGELGDIYYLYSMRVNLGIIRQRENALESLAPHDLAVALAFLSGNPTSVSAQGHAYIQPDIEDVVFGTVFFDGGQIAHVHTSWLDPHKVRKVTVVGSKKMAVIDDVEGVEKVRLYDKGVDLAPGERRYVDYAEAMSIRSGDIHIPKIDMREPLRLECQHFVDSIRNGTRPRSDGNNGLMVVRILDAAQRSLKNDGSTVRI